MPHVVVLVANDVKTDSRVRKSAVSALRSGARVTLVGLSLDEELDNIDLAGVRLTRVSVPLVYQKGVAQRRRRIRRQRRLTGYPSVAELRIARMRVEQTTIDSEYASAEGRRLRARRLALLGRWRRGVVRVRTGLQRRIDRVQNTVWRAWTGAINRSTLGARWRRVLPALIDYEAILGPEIDELMPDLIHAHDVHVLPMALHASARARKQGRQVPVIYDAHEYVSGLSTYGGRTPRMVAAWAQLEREFVRSADRIITVAPRLAERLQREYKLRHRPAVVLNTPLLDAADVPTDTDIRRVVGLPDDVPLLVYSGGVTNARGVHTAVDALVHLPEVHLAIVAVPHARTQMCDLLRARASEAGVADRLHVLDPVSPEALVPFLTTADIGLIPLLHYPSHELALTNKLFEYLHAGLPVVVSDCAAQAEFVPARGVGAVHRAEDPTDLARAVRVVLDDKAQFASAAQDRALRDEFSWERQELQIHSVYAELLGERLHLPERLPSYPSLVEKPYRVDRGGRRFLGIGPANMAGQGWAWAKAVERAFPAVDTEVFSVVRGPLRFSADVFIDATDFRDSVRWQLRWSAHVRTEMTHMLMEAARPVLGTLNGRDFSGDLAPLRAAGVQVGLIFHGSEIRDPRAHAERYAWSPFRDPGDELTARLQRQLIDVAPQVAAFEGPKFYSTPDLLDDVPDGIWLPVVVDMDVWTPGEAPLQRARPLVVHAPSRRALKGTNLIEPVLEAMVERGLIDYQQIENVTHAEMPALIRSADIVLDHFGIGNYGVVTCEAMASGRVTISHIHDRVRARVPDAIPTIEATPDTLAAVIEKVLDDRDAARETAAQGPVFVRRWHDGRRSAAALAPFLGLPVPQF